MYTLVSRLFAWTIVYAISCFCLLIKFKVLSSQGFPVVITKTGQVRTDRNKKRCCNWFCHSSRTRSLYLSRFDLNLKTVLRSRNLHSVCYSRVTKTESCVVRWWYRWKAAEARRVKGTGQAEGEEAAEDRNYRVTRAVNSPSGVQRGQQWVF